MKRAGVILALSLVVAPALSAQWLKVHDDRIPRNADGTPDLDAPAPRLPDGKPDLNGLWNATNGRFLTHISRAAGVEAPFTPWARALFDERQANEGRDRPAGFCLPHGIPDAMLVPNYPWKIIQTPRVTVILYENFTDFRQIHTDGRAYPADLLPTWFGYSLGRWDGDTFVVESRGFNGKTWLDDGGHPISEEMVITEKFRRKKFGSLEIEVTFNDPKAYTRPWTVTVPFVLPDTDIIENVCENEKDIPKLKGIRP